MTTNGDDKSVRARDITGAQIITGDNVTATMKGVKVSLVPADTVDIKAEISALRDALASPTARPEVLLRGRGLRGRRLIGVPR